MRQKRFLSWIMVFTLLVGMFSFPAYAEGNTATTTISGDGTAEKTGTMTITLTIKEMIVGAENVSVAYDGQPHGITVNVADPASDYTVKFGTTEGTYDLNASPTQTEKGSQTIYYQVTANNHVTKTGSATVTISEASAVAATVTANNRTYDGTDKPLVNVDDSTLVGGEMRYALGENAITAPAENLYTTDIPTKTDAGTYYVWYKACGDANHSDSEPDSVTVTIGETETVATPAFSPDAGTYTEAQSVTISCETTGATIYYTTDGSDPSASSTKYSSAIAVGETTTIKAIAVKDGMTDSSVASATYTINIPPQTVATPAFSPDAGTYTEAQSVTISCETTGATIYYTTDGSNPSASSTAYSGAITVGETTTIKAIAVKEGMTDSSVASTTYTISEGPEPSEETKVEVEDLSDDSISDDLKNSDFNTVSKIEDALETALSITTEEEKERSKLVDVKLMVSTDGGSTWTAATAENFPAEGIDVVLPYPDGTNGDEYSFSVAHMIGTSANGKTAGEIEKPGTTNTSSGISTHFNGLSPVMITWTKNSSPSKKDDSKSKEKAHTHHYVWETIEATEDSDGELRYKCDICGDIQTRVPITAYYVFNKNTTDKIRKAGQGATVKIETSRFISFHKMVMDALAERPDVTLEISFLDGEYKGNRVIVTIPAGTDALSLLDENGFVGFLYLASKYGYTLDN